MPVVYVILVVALLVAQLTLPRRFAMVPLLVAVFHLPNISAIEFAGLNFTICRLLILVGVIRALGTHLVLASGRTIMDTFFAVWAGWAVLSLLAHHSTHYNPYTLRLALVHEVLGGYVCARYYVRNVGDLVRFSKTLALIMIPLAVLLVWEKATAQNVYAVIGAVTEPEIRNGRVRAAGPFLHSILAGTAGATSIPLVLLLYRLNRHVAVAGAVGCVAIVISSASSGPMMTLLAALFALSLWSWRFNVAWIRSAFIVCVIGLQLVMSAPVWYLLARVDLAGGSTGWHRAELITQALNHLDEWWFAGTDFTRHWMPYGVTWTDAHSDITNFYIKLGIYGGLPLVLGFIAILVLAFRSLGRRMRVLRAQNDTTEFLLWCAGATLFAHVLALISVSYFDQTCVLLSVILGIVPGVTTFGSCAPRGVPTTLEDLKTGTESEAALT